MCVFAKGSRKCARISRKTLHGRLPRTQRLHAGKETGTSTSTTPRRTFPQHTRDASLRRLQADRPMTPQASLAPALPVVLLVLPCVPISLLSPLPRSSACAHPPRQSARAALADGRRARGRLGMPPHARAYTDGCWWRTSSWHTTARPTIELGPCGGHVRQNGAAPRRPARALRTSTGICESVMSILATPSAPAVMFPRSPAWRLSSVGAPWSLPAGLKWGPVLMQPLVVSPSWCTWKPCSPGA